MAMQFDILSAHLNSSGVALVGRTRLKGFIVSGQALAGTVDFFDAVSAPISATYGQSGNTITVTSSSHGLQTGYYIGIAFQTAGGNSATDGNYQVTVLDANTFTVTSLNEVSVSSNTPCSYVVGSFEHRTPWITAIDTSSVTAGGQTMFVTLPGEGILVHNGIYILFNSINGVTVFYG